MLLPWQIKDYEQLNTVLNAGSQAVMLHGVKGIGKRILAQELIKYRLCTNPQKNINATIATPCGVCRSCTVHASNNHPDLYTIQDEENTNVKLDVIKKLLSDSLSTTPSIANKKIVYIPDFNQITKAGANCLLKTLEEPSNSLIFIIVVEEINTVLPTILSRCAKVCLKKPNAEEMSEYLKTNHNPESASDFWYKYFYNAPLISAPFTNEQLALITTCLLKPNIYNIFKTSEEFDGKKITFTAFIDFIYKWLAYLMQTCVAHPQSLPHQIFTEYNIKQLTEKLIFDKLFNLQDDLQIYNGFLTHPINYKLHIENILFKYQQCFSSK